MESTTFDGDEGRKTKKRERKKRYVLQTRHSYVRLGKREKKNEKSEMRTIIKAPNSNGEISH